MERLNRVLQAAQGMGGMTSVPPGQVSSIELHPPFICATNARSLTSPRLGQSKSY